MKLTLLFAVACIAGGCTKRSEKYCALHPGDTENCPNDTDGGTACLTNDECIAADPTMPVCADDRVCVECTVEEDARCTDGRVCGADRRCGDCTSHDQCDSQVCQTSGRCADPAMVAYVSTTGSGSLCTLAEPCGDAIQAEATDRPIIKISGTITDTGPLVFNARSTVIYGAPGASLTRTSAGSIIEVSNDGTQLAIHDLRIFGASGVGHGILIPGTQNAVKLTLDRVLVDSNNGSGVRATDGGDVTITRSVIALNTGSSGLVLQNGAFTIRNTVIAQNGNPALINAGGAVLQPAVPSTFEFNTVADNVNTGGAANYHGVDCNAGVAVANSIIVGNDAATSCNPTYSMFSPGDFVAGTGNIMGDPLFLATSGAASPMFYRLMAQSPAKNTADMAATLAIDIDGDVRPAGGRSDMGADEVTP